MRLAERLSWADTRRSRLGILDIDSAVGGLGRGDGRTGHPPVRPAHRHRRRWAKSSSIGCRPGTSAGPGARCRHRDRPKVTWCCPASTTSTAAPPPFPRRWPARSRVCGSTWNGNLGILGTLGNNAPFIGLFGTVLGIIKAFADLAHNQSGGITVVMTGIAEALVATALGLLVAIPAVIAFNYFQGSIRRILGQVDATANLVMVALARTAPGAALGRCRLHRRITRGKTTRVRRGHAGTSPELRGRRRRRFADDLGHQRHPAGRHHAWSC